MAGKFTPEQLEAMFETMAAEYEEKFPVMSDFARQSLAFAPAISSDAIVHDNGCGPGIVSKAILAKTPGVRIEATDMTNAMVRFAAKQGASVNAQKMDSKELTFADNTFTHSFTNFVIVAMNAEEAVTTLKGIRRTLQQGATAVIVGWHHPGWMQPFLHDTVRAFAPDKAEAAIQRIVMVSDAQISEYATQAGFAADKIKMDQMRAYTDGAQIAAPDMTNMIKHWVDIITEGWNDEDKEGYWKKVQERQVQERENPQKYESVAWVVAATK